jgi:hypothetical protein
VATQTNNPLCGGGNPPTDYGISYDFDDVAHVVTAVHIWNASAYDVQVVVKRSTDQSVVTLPDLGAGAGVLPRRGTIHNPTGAVFTLPVNEPMISKTIRGQQAWIHPYLISC